LINSTVYTKDTLAEIYSLHRGDIDLLIESEAIPCFSQEEKTFIGYLPSLQASFRLNELYLEELCAKHIFSKNYKVSLDESVISISSKKVDIPASSFLYGKKWLDEASKLLEINNDFSLLLTNRPEIPIFCGHKKMINRLAENIAGDIYVVNAIEFINRLER